MSKIKKIDHMPQDSRKRSHRKEAHKQNLFNTWPQPTGFHMTKTQLLQIQYTKNETTQHINNSGTKRVKNARMPVVQDRQSKTKTLMYTFKLPSDNTNPKPESSQSALCSNSRRRTKSTEFPLWNRCLNMFSLSHVICSRLYIFLLYQFSISKFFARRNAT